MRSRLSTLFLLLWLLLAGGAAPMASGAPEPTTHDMAFPAPRFGDTVAYIKADAETGGARVDFVFRWLDHAVVPDPWGRPMAIDRVVVARGDGAQARYGYEPGRLEAATIETTGAGSMSGGDGGNGPLGGRGESEVREYLTLEYAPVWPILLEAEMCAFRGGWQGRSMDQVATLAPQSFCPGITWATRLQALGVEVVAGRLAQRVQLEGDSQSVTYWISPEVAYPLAILSCGRMWGVACDPTATSSSGVVLSGAEPGEGAQVSTAPVARIESKPTFALATFTRDGPRDGRDVAFPLDAALDAVASDDGAAHFRAWRERHPDAALVAASHQVYPYLEPSVPEREAWGLFWKTPEGETRVLSVSRDRRCTVVTNVAIPSALTRAAGVCRPGVAEVDGSTGAEATAAPAEMLTLAEATDAFLKAAAPRTSVSFIAYDVGTAQHPPTILVAGAAPRPTRLRDPTDGAGGETSSEVVSFDARTGAARYRLTTVNVTILPGSPGLVPIAPMALEEMTSTPRGLEFPRVSATTYAATGATLLGALVVAIMARAAASLVFLYTRLTRRDVLAHPRRAAILAALETDPGAGIAELRRHLGVGAGTIRYHLSVLDHAGAVKAIRSGRRVHHFLAGRADHQALMRKTRLHAGGAQARVLACIERRPGILATEIARELGVSRAAVHYTVKRLVLLRVVEARPEGGAKGLYAFGASR